MNRAKRFLAVIPFALAFLAVIAGIWGLEKSTVSENRLVKDNRELSRLLSTENDWNNIFLWLDSAEDKKGFTGLALLHLAENEPSYIDQFEQRYPRYKAWNDFQKEKQNPNYSPLIGSIIRGQTQSEFEPNAFEYLSAFNKDYYVDDAVERFITYMDTSTDRGFSVSSTKDAYQVASLIMYIMQFPDSRTGMLKAKIGEQVRNFISSTDSVEGLPLNQAFVYLYLQYYSLESLLTMKMDSFISSGRASETGITWTMDAVENLIAYFSEIGSGFPQNFYVLFKQGFSRDDPIRIYIALQVMKKIGFNDSVLNSWLNRSYDPFENTLEIIVSSTTAGFSTETVSRERIVFADEVEQTRNVISEKKGKAFATTLGDALSESNKTGDFTIQDVALSGEIQNEIDSSIGALHDQAFVENKITNWNLKRRLIDICFILTLLAAFAGLLHTVISKPEAYENRGQPLLYWTEPAILQALLFFTIWNGGDYGQKTIWPSLIAFVILSSIALLISRTQLAIPGKNLWKKACLFTAERHYGKHKTDSVLWFQEAGHMQSFNERLIENDSMALDAGIVRNLGASEIETIANRLGDREKHARLLELLETYGQSDISKRMVAKYPNSFASIEAERIRRLLGDDATWISWLKKNEKLEELNLLRMEANTIVEGLDSSFAQNTAALTALTVKLGAFDLTEEQNHANISALLNKLLSDRHGGGLLDIPKEVLSFAQSNLIDIDPVFLLAHETTPGSRTNPARQLLVQSVGRAADPDLTFLVLAQAFAVYGPSLGSDAFSSVIEMIDMGFQRCKAPITVMSLLVWAKESAEKSQSNTMINQYNGVITKHKNTIEEAIASIQQQETKDA